MICAQDNNIKFKPLTNLMPIKIKLKWTHIKQKAFNNIKPIFPHNNLSDYMDLNKQFGIYTDASYLQLEAVIFIIQDTR